MPISTDKIQYRILVCARRLAHAAGPESPHPGRVTVDDICDALPEFGVKIPSGTLRQHLETLIEEGHMETFHTQAHQYRPTGLENVTLYDLVDRARGVIDEDLDLSVGRRATTDGSREVVGITPNQFDKLRAAARRIAKHLHPDLHPEEGLREVSGTILAWDPGGGPGGNGDWTRLVEIMEGASSAPQRAQHVSSIRTLADLAATHGWIPRTDRHDPDYTPVPASWGPLQQEWRDEIRESGISTGARISMLLLQSVAELLGTGRDPADLAPSDWETVREHVEPRMVELGWPTSGRSQLRRGFQALRDRGLVNAGPWEAYFKRSKESYSDIRHGLRKKFGRVYGSRHRSQFSEEDRLAVIAALPSSLDGIKDPEGPYGLHRLLEHFTLPMTAVSDTNPARDIFPREAHRRTGPSSKTPWRANTVEYNIEQLGFLLGWVREHRGVDWSTQDLRALMDPEIYVALYDAVVEDDGEDEAPTTPDRLHRMLSLVSRISSPYMETLALYGSEVDKDLADRSARVAGLTYSSRGYALRSGARAHSLATRIRESKRLTTVERQAKKARQIERVYGEETGESDAYSALWLIFQRARKAYLATFELESSEQLADLDPEIVRAHGGQALRNLVYFQDQLLVPLRAYTSRHITMEMRPCRVGCDLTAEYPNSVFKIQQNGAMETLYSDAAGSGRYDLALWTTYAARGGVRDLELRSRGLETGAIYVPMGGETPEPSRDTDSTPLPVCRYEHLRQAMLSVLSLARTGGLDIDIQRLRDEGVASTHVFRHTIATWLCARGKIDEARLLLHHRDYKMIQHVYSGQTARSSTGTINSAALLEDVA